MTYQNKTVANITAQRKPIGFKTSRTPKQNEECAKVRK